MAASSASSSRSRGSSHTSGSISTSPIGASVIIAALSRQYAGDVLVRTGAGERPPSGSPGGAVRRRRPAGRGTPRRPAAEHPVQVGVAQGHAAAGARTLTGRLRGRRPGAPSHSCRPGTHVARAGARRPRPRRAGAPPERCRRLPPVVGVHVDVSLGQVQVVGQRQLELADADSAPVVLGGVPARAGGSTRACAASPSSRPAARWSRTAGPCRLAATSTAWTAREVVVGADVDRADVHVGRR